MISPKILNAAIDFEANSHAADHMQRMMIRAKAKEYKVVDDSGIKLKPEYQELLMGIKRLESKGMTTAEAHIAACVVFDEPDTTIADLYKRLK